MFFNMVYKSGQIFLPIFHNPRVWTDRQTDRILIARPRLHCMQRGKNRRSFSIRNNFPGPLSLFYAVLLASGVAQHRFQEHNLNHNLYVNELCIWLVKNFWGRPWL